MDLPSETVAGFLHSTCLLNTRPLIHFLLHDRRQPILPSLCAAPTRAGRLRRRRTTFPGSTVSAWTCATSESMVVRNYLYGNKSLRTLALITH